MKKYNLNKKQKAIDKENKFPNLLRGTYTKIYSITLQDRHVINMVKYQTMNLKIQQNEIL